MKPELVAALETWNDTRLVMDQLTAEIEARKERRRELCTRLEKAVTFVETLLPGDFDEEPLGLKIGDDYIVVVSYDTCVCVQVVDFNLREEIVQVEQEAVLSRAPLTQLKKRHKPLLGRNRSYHE